MTKPRQPQFMRWMARFFVLGLVALLATAIRVSASGGESEVRFLDRVMRPLSYKYGSRFYMNSPSDHFGIAWTTAPETNTGRFSAIERSIDEQFGLNSSRNEGLIKELRAKALENPDDPLQVYAWAYATCKQSALDAQMGKNYWEGVDRHRERGLLAWQLAAAKQPAERGYTRMRFLMEGNTTTCPPYLIRLGRRLLAEAPGDDRVKRSLVHKLTIASARDGFDEAAKLSAELMESDPKRLSNLGLSADVYESRYLHLGEKREDGLMALLYLERYLASAPAGCPNCVGTKLAIEFLRTDLRVP
jgi:hypothetical protein